MHMKVQAESQVPQLEKEVEEVRLKLVELAKERSVLVGATEVGRVGKRAWRNGHPIKEGAPNIGRGGGSQTLCRIATQCPPGQGRGASCYL